MRSLIGAGSRQFLGQTAEELPRRLVRSVLDHQAGGLRDDATLLLVQWTGT
jgi:hypothetical protein